MRANPSSLTSYLKPEKADEEARQKQLADDNNHKELFEQEKAKREALEAERDAEKSEAELKVAKDTASGRLQ
jgi:hypothetical protein